MICATLKKTELRKKRFESEGYDQYRGVNNKIKKCTKKAKENWTGDQCSEIEENLRKNNSKRAYHLVKLLLSKIVQENASQKNERYRTDG